MRSGERRDASNSGMGIPNPFDFSATSSFLNTTIFVGGMHVAIFYYWYIKFPYFEMNEFVEHGEA